MRRTRRLLRLISAVAMLASNACAFSQGAGAPDAPAWLRERITRYEQSPSGTSPDTIWRYEVDGKPVYYIPAATPGQFSALFDAEGRHICSPGDGTPARGEVKCAEAYRSPSRMQLVWRDPRLGLTHPPGDATR